ncbi:CYTH domain-containing protein [Bacillus gobiensis]|uniref:CYTH domain-containing protein n=1 Tax=Bacillus gobiensis TaxID=1441095 RepID=UPI003D1D53AB
MMQELEIEFKNMLTRDEFLRVQSAFAISDKAFFTQENHYFDTPDFRLKQAKSALRIRTKNGQAVLTLKEPAEVGLMETHQEITGLKQLKEFSIPEGQVKKQLENLEVDIMRIEYFGTLTTSRAEKKLESGVIVLDKSRYINKEDYELEFEVSDYEKGKRDFKDLLSEFQIPVRKTKNKIVRFYEAKMNKQQGEEK